MVELAPPAIPSMHEQYPFPVVREPVDLQYLSFPVFGTLSLDCSQISTNCISLEGVLYLIGRVNMNARIRSVSLVDNMLRIRITALSGVGM